MTKDDPQESRKYAQKAKEHAEANQSTDSTSSQTPPDPASGPPPGPGPKPASEGGMFAQVASEQPKQVPVAGGFEIKEPDVARRMGDSLGNLARVLENKTAEHVSEATIKPGDLGKIEGVSEEAVSALQKGVEGCEQAIRSLGSYIDGLSKAFHDASDHYEKQEEHVRHNVSKSGRI